MWNAHVITNKEIALTNMNLSLNKGVWFSSFFDLNIPTEAKAIYPAAKAAAVSPATSLPGLPASTL